MADKKISQLTSAVLPLAGTELVPVVQSGATVKVTAASLGAAAEYTPAGTGAVVTTVQSKLRQTISVEDFGAVGDGVTDDTIALQSAALAIKTNGGGTLIFGPEKTYKVFVTGGFSSAVLLDFTNCVGLNIEGNGSTILTGADTAVRYGILLNSVSNVSIKNLVFQSQLASLSSSQGMAWIVANYGANKITLENLSFTYGQTGFQVQGQYASGGTDSNRARNISALNLYFFSVYYPLSFQGAGDNFFGRGIVTRNCGRSYFPINVKNHDIYIDSQQGGPFSDCLLKVYCDPTLSYNRLENIKLNYSSTGRYAGSGNQSSNEAMIAIDLQQNTATSTAGFVGNVEITYSVEADSSNKNQSFFIVRKYNFAGSADSTPRGHQLFNVNLQGSGLSAQNLLSDYINIFNRTGDDWTGDFAQHFDVSKFTLTGSNPTDRSIVYNTAPVSGQCLINEVHSTGSVILVGSSNKYFGILASYFSNYFTGFQLIQPYTVLWTGAGSNPAIGNGVLSAYFILENKTCTVQISLTIGSTTTFGSGVWSFSLPYALNSISLKSLGSAVGFNSGVNFYSGVSIIYPTSGSKVTVFLGTSGNNVGSTVPWTWKTGDTLDLQISYPV